MVRVAAMSKNVIRSELRCKNRSDESQIGSGRGDSGSVAVRSERPAVDSFCPLRMLLGATLTGNVPEFPVSVAAPLAKRDVVGSQGLGLRKRPSVFTLSIFCPAVLDGILVTVGENATLDRISLELAAGLLDRCCWGRTERGTAFINLSPIAVST